MEPARKKKYTYADYLTWDDDKRCELIDGEVYMLAAPSSTHQEIFGNLFLELGNYLKGKNCKVYPAPYDVRLNAEAEDDTVVQPDISVICDPSKIEERGCKGAPDMVIEILSPSTTRHDQVVKLNQYCKAGVREYWLVDPERRQVQINLLKDGMYINRGYYGDTDTVSVNILDDCQINLADIFPALPED